MGTLINGLEVLSQTEISTAKALNPLAFWALTLIFFSVGVAFCYFELKPITAGEWAGSITIIFLITLLGCAFGYIVGMSTGKPTDYETHYKVLISDEVSLNEFNEKYEIIEQDGKIFEIKEKSND